MSKRSGEGHKEQKIKSGRKKIGATDQERKIGRNRSGLGKGNIGEKIGNGKRTFEAKYPKWEKRSTME